MTARSARMPKQRRICAHDRIQMEKDGMGSVLKHFPGYGPNGDTHEQTVIDMRNLKPIAPKIFCRLKPASRLAPTPCSSAI